ncbi:formimidoylglutamase [Mesonia ostreae]|uniref:Formimidoylglutamase n=1 Tax=Mesonia ostreae TaxID=861110 RepID=A0ABU2KJS4_9FLAO|nr:formimidoylglutamase [Mesonia ostreae]MDT0294955.1 formimidoylglutamase [Mesonia ostreae]
MIFFNFLTENSAKAYINSREGETKLGESINYISSFEELEHTAAKYVIFGVPEDIGIRANQGKPGASSTWEPFLKAFLNIQHNSYNANNCVVLGNIKTEELQQKAEHVEDPKLLGEMLPEIDDMLSEVVQKIVSLQKVPIIIGGGHNNSYGNIKGCSKALEKPIDVLNIDAHTDLRTTNFRHSGNGFSYAKKEGFLNHYALVGIHQNYTPRYIFDMMNEDKTISYSLFEEYLHLTTIDKLIRFKKAINFVRDKFALELDCDAIQDFNSSAMTPSGFSINEIRSFINLAKKQQVYYLHICEADASKNPMIAKALSYFVSDFIRPETN